jgi:hypothetical protein
MTSGSTVDEEVPGGVSEVIEVAVADEEFKETTAGCERERTEGEVEGVKLDDGESEEERTAGCKRERTEGEVEGVKVDD